MAGPTRLIVLMLAALAVAGCGGEAPGEVAGIEADANREALEEAVRSARDTVREGLADVARAPERAQVVDALETSAARVEEAADELDARPASSELRQPSRDLSLALDHLAVALRQTADEARERDPEAVAREVLRRDEVRNVADALESFRDTGVDLEPLDLDVAERGGFDDVARESRGDVERSLADLTAAGDGDALAAAVARAADRLFRAAERLEAAGVPDELRAVRDDLVAALEQLATELDRQTPGGLRDLGRLDDLDDVRRALDELAAAASGS